MNSAQSSPQAFIQEVLPSLATICTCNGCAYRHGSAHRWLTQKQIEVWKLLAEGWTNGAMAGIMGIEVRTVEHHINALFNYLHLEEVRDFNRRVLAARMYDAWSQTPR